MFQPATSNCTSFPEIGILSWGLRKEFKLIFGVLCPRSGWACTVDRFWQGWLVRRCLGTVYLETQLTQHPEWRVMDCLTKSTSVPLFISEKHEKMSSVSVTAVWHYKATLYYINIMLTLDQNLDLNLSGCFLVNSALRNKGYQMEERGEIEVKGKGRMRTYFLQRNLKVTESEIMGLLVHHADNDRNMNHSTRDCASQLPHYRPALKGLLNVSSLFGYQS